MSYAFRVIEQELKVEIDKITPQIGDILVFHPKREDHRFSNEFCNWLAGILPELLPPGIKALIVANDSTKVERLKPELPTKMSDDPSEAFEMGWYAAFEALEKFYAEDIKIEVE